MTTTPAKSIPDSVLAQRTPMSEAIERMLKSAGLGATFNKENVIAKSLAEGKKADTMPDSIIIKGVFDTAGPQFTSAYSNQTTKGSTETTGNKTENHSAKKPKK